MIVLFLHIIFARKEIEMAYFEGQRDALSGDVRVGYKNNCWRWIKSPWDGIDLQPSYKPSCQNNE